MAKTPHFHGGNTSSNLVPIIVLGFNSVAEDTAYIRVVAGSIPAIPTRGLTYSLTGVCEVVIKETHNKQAVSRKYNKSSSDRTLENIPMRLVAFDRVHLVNFAVFP